MPLFSENADVSVRPAIRGDEHAIARLQVEAWRVSHAEVLGEGALDLLDASAIEAQWASAVTSPPGAGFRVLVACDGPTVVGVVSVAPVPTSEDRPFDAPGGAILALEVEPAHQRVGHGSRLLAAAVDTLREDGADQVHTWVLDGDEAARSSCRRPDWDPTTSCGAGLRPHAGRLRAHRHRAPLVRLDLRHAATASSPGNRCARPRASRLRAVQPAGRPQRLAGAPPVPRRVVGEREVVPRTPVVGLRLARAPGGLEGHGARRRGRCGLRATWAGRRRAARRRRRARRPSAGRRWRAAIPARPAR